MRPLSSFHPYRADSTRTAAEPEGAGVLRVRRLRPGAGDGCGRGALRGRLRLQHALRAGDDLPRLVDDVRVHGDGGDPPGHQLLGQLRVVARGLAADGAGDAPLPGRAHQPLQGDHHRLVPLVELRLELGVVAVDPQDELRQVVRADADAIDANVDEPLEEEDVGRHLRHHPELEAIRAREAFALQHRLDLGQLLRRAHEGDHHPEVRVLLAHPLDRLDLHLERLFVAHVAGDAAEPDHGVLLDGLVLLAALEVAVLVRLEVGRAVDHGPWLERGSERAEAGGQLLDELLGPSLLEDQARVLAYLGNDELRAQEADAVHVQFSHAVRQLRLRQVDVDPGARLDVRGHRPALLLPLRPGQPYLRAAL